MATKKEKPLAERFAEAKGRVEHLTKRPTNDQLLDLYAFYKQATAGDVAGGRPGLLDLEGRGEVAGPGEGEGGREEGGGCYYGGSESPPGGAVLPRGGGVFHLAPPPAQPLALPAVLERAAQNSPDLRAAYAQVKVAEAANDQPTCDLLTQRLQVHEKTAWMLRTLLED